VEVKEASFRLKAFDLTARTFEGYISTFEDPENYDTYGDIVAPGFFAEDIASRGPKSADPRIKVLLNHDWDRPIGLPVEMYEDQKGCFARAQLPEGIPDADLALKYIEKGLLDSLSFAYEVIESIYLEDKPTRWGFPVRKLIKGRTIEFSPVTFAANDNARILKSREERKSAWLASSGRETKEGRTISTKNLEKLSKAHELLGEVISSAAPSEDGKAFNQALEELRSAVESLTGRI
jgi:HK97 family phage prohead protease